MVTFRQAIAFFFFFLFVLSPFFFCAALILLLAGTDLSSTQCHLEASIIISCAFQLHSITWHFVPAMPGFLPWSRSFSASMYHCMRILPLFSFSLIGFPFRTAVFSVLALSFPKFLLFIYFPHCWRHTCCVPVPLSTHFCLNQVQGLFPTTLLALGWDVFN